MHFLDSMRNRLLVLFLLAGLAPVIVIGLWAATLSDNALRQQAYDSLTTIRTIKGTQMKLFFEERQQFALATARSPWVGPALRDLAAAFNAAAALFTFAFQTTPHTSCAARGSFPRPTHRNFAAGVARA